MNNVQGYLFGMAYGDSLGSKTEFSSLEMIYKRFPPNGPKEIDDPAFVTDDTQMALAVGEALMNVELPFTLESVEPHMRDAFVQWLHHPDNNRAPGVTCLSACRKLETGIPWQDATVVESKGCGANMRVAPVGLLALKNIDTQTRSALAQFQSALTHGHPTGLAASDITAETVAYLITGGSLDGMIAYLLHYAKSQRSIYHETWLGDLWMKSNATTPQQFIQKGWDECIPLLEILETELTSVNRNNDPCLVTGAGWIAEEAFATSLLCFMLYPDNPVHAIRRAAASSGDSDSIACLAGAFAGAYKGIDAWPSEWHERIEYRNRLDNLSKFFGAI